MNDARLAFAVAVGLIAAVAWMVNGWQLRRLDRKTGKIIAAVNALGATIHTSVADRELMRAALDELHEALGLPAIKWPEPPDGHLGPQD